MRAGSRMPEPEPEPDPDPDPEEVPAKSRD
jgi:hypothetical protein